MTRIPEGWDSYLKAYEDGYRRGFQQGRISGIIRAGAFGGIVTAFTVGPLVYLLAWILE